MDAGGAAEGGLTEPLLADRENAVEVGCLSPPTMAEERTLLTPWWCDDDADSTDDADPLFLISRRSALDAVGTAEDLYLAPSSKW